MPLILKIQGILILLIEGRENILLGKLKALIVLEHYIIVFIINMTTSVVT